MSNADGTSARREEEIAFLIMEHVLGVDIQLADAGGGNSMPDGAWTCPQDPFRRGIVEVTSPPEHAQMAEWVRAKRVGAAQSESGITPGRPHDLDLEVSDLLAEDWAGENFRKLLAQDADERHLFLFARSYKFDEYFYQLSESIADGTTELAPDLALRPGITDVWFRGRSVRARQPERMNVSVARFQAGAGWLRYEVPIEESQLPAPPAHLADDRLPQHHRSPKNRS